MAAVEVKLDPTCLTATARELRHARDRLRCLFKTPSIVLLVLLGIAFMSMVFVSLNVFAVYFLLFLLHLCFGGAARRASCG